EDKGLRQNVQLQALLDPASATAPISERALAVYAPLRDYLAQQNRSASTVVGATVWTTADMTTRFRTGSAHVAQMPLAPAQGIHLEEEFADYCVIGGTVDVPGFQKGAI